MKKTRNRYSREFKLEAIALSNQPGMTVAQVERDLGLPQGRLYQWRHRHGNNGSGAFPGKGNLTPEAARIRELERELAMAQQERDILKKALAIFSQATSK